MMQMLCQKRGKRKNRNTNRIPMCPFLTAGETSTSILIINIEYTRSRRKQ